MKIRRPQFVLFGAALAALLSLLPLFPGQVLAHERRPVAGKYQLVVGFLNEPAFAGQMNGIDLRVTVPAEGDKPIEGLEKTLKATVIRRSSLGRAASTTCKRSSRCSSPSACPTRRP
ncbi:MAG: hypothetical protein HYU88_12445 [Chloroflexi bacterium]|nr:hypothetical protein [Chloroflexota bacterium]